jgi:hypothetical protein
MYGIARFSPKRYFPFTTISATLAVNGEPFTRVSLPVASAVNALMTFEALGSSLGLLAT